MLIPTLAINAGKLLIFRHENHHNANDIIRCEKKNNFLFIKSMSLDLVGQNHTPCTGSPFIFTKNFLHTHTHKN